MKIGRQHIVKQFVLQYMYNFTFPAKYLDFCLSSVIIALRKIYEMTYNDSIHEILGETVEKRLV
jgi:hypothetical protein